MSNGSRLLLVEDDQSLGQTLQERLERHSYQVTWAKTLSQAREKIKNENFDLIILDLGLPDGSGFDFAREVKKANKAPFIFMTANASAPHRLEGFEIGAEEFIPKPFHLKEIFLRIKHVLETHAEKKQFRVGSRIIDFAAMSVTRDGEEIEYLPPKDFKLLELLIKAAPKVVSRDEILDALWGDEKFPTNRTVDNMIVRLRDLFGDGGEYIRSVRGIGYQWKPSLGKPSLGKSELERHELEKPDLEKRDFEKFEVEKSEEGKSDSEKIDSESGDDTEESDG